MAFNTQQATFMSRFVNKLAAKAFSANSVAIPLFDKFNEKEKFTAYLNRFNVYTDLKKVTVRFGESTTSLLIDRIEVSQ